MPAERTKTGEALDIPLVPTVVSGLETLHTLADRSEWVSPRRKQDKHQHAPHVSFDTLNVAIGHDRHDYYKERRAALGQWTALLIQAEEGTTQVTTIGAPRSANSSANIGRKAQ